MRIGPLLDAWMFEVSPGRHVFIVAYTVFCQGDQALTISHEHKRMQWWPLDALPADALPAGYQRAIAVSRNL